MEHGAIVEYRDTKPEQFSKVTRLDSAVVGRREYRLSHHSDGFEPAGSCARYSAREAWSVLFEANNATHGRRFKTLAEAQSLFNDWKTRIA